MRVLSVKAILVRRDKPGSRYRPGPCCLPRILTASASGLGMKPATTERTVYVLPLDGSQYVTSPLRGGASSGPSIGRSMAEAFSSAIRGIGINLVPAEGSLRRSIDRATWLRFLRRSTNRCRSHLGLAPAYAYPATPTKRKRRTKTFSLCGRTPTPTSPS